MKTLENAVTMVCHRYTPFPAGGADRQAQDIAEALVKQGWKVDILTMRLPGTKKKEIIHAVPVSRLWTSFVPKIQGTLFLSQIFWHLLFKPGPRVIHLNQMYREMLPALLVRRLRGFPVVMVDVCGGAFGEIARLQVVPFGRWMLKLARKTDVVISLSEQITEELLEHGFDPARIVKIPTGVDTQRFTPVSAGEQQHLRDELQLPKDGPLVIFTGRLHFQKALDTLIRAWQHAQQVTPKAHLLILGEGEEEQKLRALTAKLGLESSIHFMGHIEGVLPYLQAADVFVLPSTFEGLSVSLLEAMACAKAIVTTNIGGTVEAIRPDVEGLLFAPGDVLALAACLSQVLSDAALRQRLGANARQRVETLFSREKLVASFAAVYERLGAHQQVEQSGVSVAESQEASIK